jgi:acetate kinase
MNVFCARIAFYIGGYASLLNGVDAIVFTAGIGEGAWYVRKQVCDYLEYLGVELDIRQNRKGTILISKKDSNVKVYVIPTNEELQMVREAKELI